MNLKVWIVLPLFAISGCSNESGDQGANGESVSFASVVEKSAHLKGLFDVYRDKDSG